MVARNKPLYARRDLNPLGLMVESAGRRLARAVEIRSKAL
jgi:hypothetical protein